MTKYILLLQFYLIFFLSRAPIFALSIDECFHKVDFKSNLQKGYKVRFSLISLGFGNKKIYFFTIKDKKKNFFLKLKYDGVINYPKLDLVSKRDTYYDDYLSSYSDKYLSFFERIVSIKLLLCAKV